MHDNLINVYREEINHKLQNIYTSGPESLVTPINYVLTGKGKRIRPLLTLMTADSFNGNSSDALSAALAVEILHNFTLVHDDIMDEDHLRHGKATVHHKWDNGVAILTGDAMLSLALKMIEASPRNQQKLMTSFIQGLLAVCEGQAIDKEFETKADINLDEYIEMINLKTGHLIGLSAELGAISANCQNEEIKAVRDYGRLIGRAFQIQDDYLEIFSNPKNMGKSLGSDILLGKQTYLMILGKQYNATKLNDIIELINNDIQMGLNEIKDFYRNSGIENEVLKIVSELINEADKLLLQLNIDHKKLKYFSKMIMNRGN